MRWLLVVGCAVVGGCAHTGIRKVSDCQEVQGEARLECGACVAPNEAAGWLGTHEYRPRESPDRRCVQVK